MITHPKSILLYIIYIITKLTLIKWNLKNNSYDVIILLWLVIRMKMVLRILKLSLVLILLIVAGVTGMYLYQYKEDKRINEDYAKVNNLIDGKKYSDAKESLDDMSKKYGDQYNKERIEDLKKKCNELIICDTNLVEADDLYIKQDYYKAYYLYCDIDEEHPKYDYAMEKASECKNKYINKQIDLIVEYRVNKDYDQALSLAEELLKFSNTKKIQNLITELQILKNDNS